MDTPVSLWVTFAHRARAFGRHIPVSPGFETAGRLEIHCEDFEERGSLLVFVFNISAQQSQINHY